MAKPAKAPKRSVKVEDLDPPDRAVVDTWHEHCGSLPRWDVVDPDRFRLLRRAQERHGDALLDLLADAAREVARDEFWQRKGYGLTNLLTGSKLLDRAAAWRKRAAGSTSSGSPPGGGHREMSADELLTPSNLDGQWRN